MFLNSLPVAEIVARSGDKIEFSPYIVQKIGHELFGFGYITSYIFDIEKMTDSEIYLKHKDFMIAKFRLKKCSKIECSNLWKLEIEINGILIKKYIVGFYPLRKTPPIYLYLDLIYSEQKISNYEADSQNIKNDKMDQKSTNSNSNEISSDNSQNISNKISTKTNIIKKAKKIEETEIETINTDEDSQLNDRDLSFEESIPVFHI